MHTGIHSGSDDGFTFFDFDRGAKWLECHFVLRSYAYFHVSFGF